MPHAGDKRELEPGKRESREPQTIGRRTLLRGAMATLPAAAGLVWVPGCSGSSNAQTAPQPQNPQEALQALKDGNQRWVQQQPRIASTAEIEERWTHTALTQTPFASVLTCADSRLAPELIFDQFIGDLFVVREAGNIASGPTPLGSLEYAQVVLGSLLILVLGHTRCGAVGAAFRGDMPGGNIDAIVEAIAPSIEGATTLDEAIVDNVFAVIESVRANSPTLRQAECDGIIDIVGGLYDVSTGEVEFLSSAPQESCTPTP